MFHSQIGRRFLLADERNNQAIVGCSAITMPLGFKETIFSLPLPAISIDVHEMKQKNKFEYTGLYVMCSGCAPSRSTPANQGIYVERDSLFVIRANQYHTHQKWNSAKCHILKTIVLTGVTKAEPPTGRENLTQKSSLSKPLPNEKKNRAFGNNRN